MPNSATVTVDLPRNRTRAAPPAARSLSGPVRPLASALSVAAISSVLVATIFLTRLNMEWITFLTGVLVAALLAEATRVSRAEWALMRRTAQLSSAKEKLEKEARSRKNAELYVNACKPRMHLVDNVLPTMVLFVDADGRCRYHNRAFRDWLRFGREQIEGIHLNEVLGPMVFQEIAAHVRQALDGHTVKYLRNQKLSDGSVRKLGVVHVPQYAEGNRITGFYMLTDDITEYADALVPVRTPAVAAARPQQRSLVDAAVSVAASGVIHHEQHEALHSERANLVAAIEKDEFRLFCQKIAPLRGGTGRAEFNEVLVRLMEEEEGMIPPGAFFPLAEEFGMMSHLDRWVVRHVAEWIAIRVQQHVWAQGSIYFINLSDETIADAGFGDYLEVTLKAYGIPGTTLCFEVPASDVTPEKNATLAAFARRIERTGARIAVSGCGHDDISIDKLAGFRPDFVKIDGSVLLSLPNDPEALARVTAVSQLARQNGIKTIAEMVESRAVLTKLQEIGIDFAQGFGISQPRPLNDKRAGQPSSAQGNTGAIRSPLTAGRPA